MDGGDDPSALAWLWVIEALSACKEIPDSTLLGKRNHTRLFSFLISFVMNNFMNTVAVVGHYVGLIDAAPVAKDKFGENTKEMVSLRCLEKLSTSMVDRVASSTSDSRAGFDFSRSCQDVLQEILDEVKQFQILSVFDITVGSGRIEFTLV